MKHLLIRMDRPNLEGLPSVRLPEGYRLETASGDFEPTWARVVNAAFLNDKHTAEKCRKQFSSRARFDPEGMFFVLTPDGEPVATAFAWIDTPDETECGRVHWVATVPGQQGKGLGRAVTLAVLHYLREHGFTRAFLETQPYRLPAIRLYLSLGLEPTPKNAEHEECWRQIMEKIAEIEDRGP